MVEILWDLLGILWALVGLITCDSAGADISSGSSLASGSKLLPQHRRHPLASLRQHASEVRGVYVDWSLHVEHQNIYKHLETFTPPLAPATSKVKECTAFNEAGGGEVTYGIRGRDQ